MRIADDIRGVLAKLPVDVGEMNPIHYAVAGRLQRRLSDAGKDVALAFRRSRHVDEHSRQVEKEWLRDALLRAEDYCDACDAFDEWFVASGIAKINKPLAENHKRGRRAAAKLRRDLCRFADPMQPGWRRPRRQFVWQWSKRRQRSS